MRVRLNVVVTSTLVMAIGLITFLGLLIGDDLGNLTLLRDAFQLSFLAQFFLRLSVITVSMTIIIGILNLLSVHAVRTVSGRGSLINRLNSPVLLLSFALALVLYVINRPASMILLEDVQVAIESSLAALLFFALVYGALRIMRRGVTVTRILFVVSMLVILIGSLPLAGLSPVRQISDWLITVPVNAGARGILLGIALATLVTGIRVLIGQDRTYSG